MREVLPLLRGVLALLAGTIAVSASQVLRADSDGPAPGVAVTVAGALLLAAMFWPLTRRRHSLFLLYGGLVAVQVVGHALLLFASTGRFGSGGAVGLVCCPSVTPAGDAGPLDSLTARAGWLLLAVQLLTALVLAIALRAAQGVVLDVGAIVASAVGSALRAPAALLRLLAAVPAVVAAPRQVGAAEPLLRKGRNVTGRVRRRGPPNGGFVPPFGSPSRLRGAVAL